MSPSIIQRLADCGFEEACDILEIIEQVLPMSNEGIDILLLSLPEQIKFARSVLA